MAVQVDVERLMSGELGDWLQDQVSVRAEAKEKSKWRWTLAAAVLLPALAFLWFGPDWDTQLKAFITLFLSVVAWIWGYGPIDKAKKTVKIGINSAIAEALGITYSHDTDPGHEWELARSFRLIPKYDRDSFEDEWLGALGGHAFRLYEAECKERRGSGKNARWVTVFRGAVIRITSQRSFHGITLLQRDGEHKGFLGFGGRKDEVTLGGVDLRHADMVSPEFEDVFDVYTTDQVEARWLVHPEYLERLLELERAFQGKNVRALFHRGELIVAIESGNMFESGSIDPEEDHAKVRKTTEQFARLASLAMELNRERAER